MKSFSSKSLVVATLLGAAGIAGMMLVHAQETATFTTTSIVPRSWTELRSIESYSDTQLNQLVNALAATPLIWPTNLPNEYMEGYNGIGYWSLAHPNWPPLPSAFGTPFWDLTPRSTSLSTRSLASDSSSNSGFFLLDDVDFPPFPGDGDGGTNVYNPPVFQMALPTTNDLWLEVVSTTNTGASVTANLIIHPPWDKIGGVWDIFAITNLASNTWQWVYRSAAQTNVTLTGLAYPNEFFRAASTNDTDGDSLSDAYEIWVSHTNPYQAETDAYGVSYAWYIENGLDISSALQDPDQDALLNYQEYQYGTKPQVSEGFAVWTTTSSNSSIP